MMSKQLSSESLPAFKLENLLNSHFGTDLGLMLSKVVPPMVGYPLANLIADIISAFRLTNMVRAVHANQLVIHDQQPGPRQLDALVRETFRSSARSLYEFWHFFRDPQAVVDRVEFDPSFVRSFRQARKGDAGTIMVAPHFGNFDLIGRAFALRGLDVQVLSYPQPPGGYQRQNLLRQIPGLRVTPMSIQALREASQTLNARKVVLTCVDRPLPEGPDAKYRPKFFGRAAAMPVFHIRLALKHNLPITVLGACRRPDGCYYVWATEPIPMQHYPDLMQETVLNAEAILAHIAEVIRQAPAQWAMYYPVWPETLDMVR